MKWSDRKNFFVKSHGLGNDYIVLDSLNIDFKLTFKTIKRICDVPYGIGSDGILLKIPSETCDFGLRIFNPDGSEAEKSGNGLRIFSKYLFDYGRTEKKSFSIETAGGTVRSSVVEIRNGKAVNISVEMGKAEFEAAKIPVALPGPEIFGYKARIDDRDFELNCVSMGNPHCVVIRDKVLTSEVHRYGPLLENHFYFPNRTNVQFVSIEDRDNIKVEIWERGAGYTNASGSSACAAVSVLRKLDLCNPVVTVKMPGGSLVIGVDENRQVLMTGPVQEIARGYLSEEIFL